MTRKTVLNNWSWPSHAIIVYKAAGKKRDKTIDEDLNEELSRYIKTGNKNTRMASEQALQKTKKKEAGSSESFKTDGEYPEKRGSSNDSWQVEVPNGMFWPWAAGLSEERGGRPRIWTLPLKPLQDRLYPKVLGVINRSEHL